MENEKKELITQEQIQKVLDSIYDGVILLLKW